jgi:hypothetical protein
MAAEFYNEMIVAKGTFRNLRLLFYGCYDFTFFPKRVLLGPICSKPSYDSCRETLVLRMNTFAEENGND